MGAAIVQNRRGRIGVGEWKIPHPRTVAPKSISYTSGSYCTRVWNLERARLQFLAQLLPQVVEVELDSALLTRQTLDVFLEVHIT